jgi:LPXTG-motif cell wall-anchored protein
MPDTWSLSGVTRRLLVIVIAAALALASLAVIPGAVQAAHAEDGTAQDAVLEETGPSLTIEKSTNGQDADNPPGPVIPAEDPVTWTYVVTNNGGVALENITVTDDNTQGASISCTGQVNGSITLAPGESIECSASSLSLFTRNLQLHVNTATATGTVVGQQGSVADTDRSHYTPTLVCPYGPAPDRIIIDIFRGDPTGDGGYMLQQGWTVGPIPASVPAGTYTVSWASYDWHDFKPGQVQLEEIWRLRVGDSVSDPTTDIPETTDFAQGTLANRLVVGANQTQVTVEHAAVGTSINSVYAICAVLDPVPAGIDITKTTEDSEVSPGETATFTITVTNTGQVPLTDVVVTDEQTPSCDFGAGDMTTVPGGAFDGTLAVGESFSYTCTTDALAASFLNTADVVGVPPAGPPVTDTDDEPVTVVETPVEGTIEIVKEVWNQLGTPPAWAKDGQLPQSETTAKWRIKVTNPNEFDLRQVSLTDANAPACEVAFDAAIRGEGWNSGDELILPAGQSVTFECESTVVAGQPGSNTAVTSGVDPEGVPVGPAESTATFGRVAASGTIGDTVWSDENGNGIQDNGEKGIAGARLRLTLPDGSTLETTTNANGLYLFSALPAGTYKVELIMSSLPTPSEGNLKLTTPGLFNVTLGEGQSFLDADFGVVATLPDTGLSSDQFAVIGLVLTLFGVTSLVLTRRRDEGTTNDTMT